ncbi:MAG: hypothetical protein ACRERY_15475 [Pseudomonas sp.]
MKTQLLLSLALSVLAANAFAVPSDNPQPLLGESKASPNVRPQDRHVTEGGADRLLQRLRVAEGGAERTGLRVAEDGADRTGLRVAEDGADRTGLRVAEDGADRTGLRVAEGGAERLLEQRRAV